VNLRPPGSSTHHELPLRKRLRLSLVPACRNPPKWPVGVSELSGVKDLETRIVLSVEGCDDVWATCFYHVLWVVEPEAEMIELDRVCCGVVRCIRGTPWVVERVVWSGSNAGRHDERFNIETADELAVAFTVPVGLDIPLVPG
jgi:hypothetical protein